MYAPTIGHYRLVGEIGQGSFGKVFKCVDVYTGAFYACKTVNVKTVREDARLFENFKNELRANAQIRHPGIVRLVDVQCDRMNIFLILELCPGGTLEQRVKESNGLSEAQARIVFCQLMKAV